MFIYANQILIFSISTITWGCGNLWGWIWFPKVDMATTYVWP